MKQILWEKFNIVKMKCDNFSFIAHIERAKGDIFMSVPFISDKKIKQQK